MNGRTDGKMVSMLLVIALLAVGLTAGGASGAQPAAGTIRWGQTVTWSGEVTRGSGFVSGVVGDMSVCPPGACDDFLLNIQVAPSPNPARVRFVEIDMETTDPQGMALVVFPPGADPTRDWVEYTNEITRLMDPEPGWWRIQARCGPAGPCRATYSATARTGSLRVPRVVAHRVGGSPLGSLRVGALIPRVRSHQVGASAWEPTLGITEEGAVFYQAFSSLQVPKVLRSEDGGETWDNVSPRLGTLYRHPHSSDPFLQVDEDTGRVFTVDMIPPFTCNELSFSDDGGAGWTTTAICEHAPDHQNLFTGPPALSPTIGYPNIVYWCVNGNGFMTSACSKSLDGGLTFVPTGSPAYTNPWPVDENDECSVGLVGHGVVGPDGTVYLPRGHCGQPFVAISPDEGLTWTQVQVADNGMPVGSPILEDLPEENVGEHETAVAVDEEGTVYYAWVAYDRLPYLAMSTDGGLTWSDPMMVGPPGVNEAALPALDVGAPGKVAIAYMGTENSPGGPPFPGERQGTKDDALRPGYEGVTWNGYITMTAAALDEDPVFFTATVNDPADPLVVGTCGPTRCARAGDFFDVVIAPDGTPWAAFVDACVVDRCDVLVGEGIVGRLVGGPSLR